MHCEPRLVVKMANSLLNVSHISRQTVLVL